MVWVIVGVFEEGSGGQEGEGEGEKCVRRSLCEGECEDSD